MLTAQLEKLRHQLDGGPPAGIVDPWEYSKTSESKSTNKHVNNGKTYLEFPGISNDNDTKQQNISLFSQHVTQDPPSGVGEARNEPTFSQDKVQGFRQQDRSAINKAAIL